MQIQISSFTHPPNHTQLLFPTDENNFRQILNVQDDPDMSFARQDHQKIKVRMH